MKWRLIRAQVLEAGVSKRQAARDAGIHWKTLEKVLENPFPPKCKRKKSHKLRRFRQCRSTFSKRECIVADIKNKLVESAVFIRDTVEAIPRSATPVGELGRLARFLQKRG